MVNNPGVICIPNHLNDLSKHLYQLQQDGMLCDACLVCKDGVVFLHKIILMSCESLYFQQQISTYNSNFGNGQCQVMLKDFTIKCVSNFVEGLYTGCVTISNNNKEELADLSSFLGISTFLDAICGTLDRDTSNGSDQYGDLMKGNIVACENNNIAREKTSISHNVENILSFKKEPIDDEHDEKDSISQTKDLNHIKMKHEESVTTDRNSGRQDMYMYDVPTVSPSDESSRTKNLNPESPKEAKDRNAKSQRMITTGCLMDTKRRLAVVLKDCKKKVKKSEKKASVKKRKVKMRHPIVFEDFSDDDSGDEADELEKSVASAVMESLSQDFTEDELYDTKRKKRKSKLLKTRKVLKEKAPKGVTIPTKIGEGRFLCDVCGKRYSCTKNLRRHKLVHNGSRPYMCGVCCKTFKTEEKYKSHTSKHSGEKLFDCPHCDKKFDRRTAVDRHVRTHTGEKPYMCEECGSQFSQTSNLKLHMKTVHTEFRPRNHHCEICGMSFYSSQNLNLHKRSHSDERPYKCKVCGLTFKYSNPLRRHMMKHTGERPHKCKFCGRGFIASDHLAKHVLIHTDEKPYECEYCGRCFRCKANLTRHTIMHTGNYPFRCDVCGKGFARKNYIQKHLLEHSSSQRPQKIERRHFGHTPTKRPQNFERHSLDQTNRTEFAEKQSVVHPPLLETEIQSALNILEPTEACAVEFLY